MYVRTYVRTRTYVCKYVCTYTYVCMYVCMYVELSGSVVECLTRDHRTAGSSLTGITALCP